MVIPHLFRKISPARCCMVYPRRGNVLLTFILRNNRPNPALTSPTTNTKLSKKKTSARMVRVAIDMRTVHMLSFALNGSYFPNVMFYNEGIGSFCACFPGFHGIGSRGSSYCVCLITTRRRREFLNAYQLYNNRNIWKSD